MENLLKSKFYLIGISVILLCYLISFISHDVVMNDKVYQKHLDDKYEAKYNEYKDLDIDLSEFENELKKFEQSTTENNNYDWGDFYVDSIFIVIPLLLVSLGFSATFLIIILFNKRLYTIKYLDILKVTLISYLVFYLTEIISAIYFLIFKQNYELKDIHSFESFFRINKFFDKNNTSEWLWNIVSGTGFVYLLFPLLVGLLLSIIYKDFKKSILIGYSYLAYFIIFIFYHTVFWYLFDLL